MDRKKNSNRVSGTLFILILAGISLFYGYHRIVKYPPQSIHAWRQSDCASITLNYYRNGMKFFHPEIHNLIADGGTTGFVAPSEVPIFYYAIAGLYHIFGPNDSLMRLFNILIFFLGLLYLFRLFHLVLHDYFWAGALAVLLFTSPVLVYYANNYLTNITSLSFAIIGCFHFFLFSGEKKNKYLLCAALMFLLAGSFKITGLFSVMVIMGLLIMDGFKLGISPKIKPGIFERPLLQFLPFLVILIIVGGWVFYARGNNQSHDTAYFSTQIRPIWDYDLTGIKSILGSAIQLWGPDYFSPLTLLLILALAISLAVNHRFTDRVLLLFTLLLIPVILLYAALQFYAFAEHDYFTINMYILPVFVLAASMQGWMKRYPAILGSVLLFWNLHYAGKRLDLRYTGWRNESSQMIVYRDIRQYLPDMGIAETDTVICISGRSQHALYLLNMKGWTEYYGESTLKDSLVYFNRDSAGIQASIDLGAMYLLAGGFDQLIDKPHLQSFTGHLVGKHNDIMVFDLLAREHNFYLYSRRLVQEVFCNAEHISDDGLSFLTSDDSIQLEYGNSRTGEKSWSGRYAARLLSNHPYSMTLTLEEVMKDQSFEVSAWMLDPSDECRIIASAGDPGEFYLNSNEIEISDSLGWSRKSLQFFIPEAMHGKSLKIYLYYSGKDSAWCDDYYICRYESPFQGMYP